MKPSELNRRDFSKLTVAALGGMMAGSAIGCGGGEDNVETAPATGGGAGGGETTGTETTETETTVAAAEKHVCRGLNACKGLDKDHSNACAGQGACATAEHHVCATENACKGQGGCGETAGKNECRGQGGCSVPLHGGIWETVREQFTTAMKGLDKTVGEAPAAVEKD
jgi:hypothetical protein